MIGVGLNIYLSVFFAGFSSGAHIMDGWIYASKLG